MYHLLAGRVNGIGVWEGCSTDGGGAHHACILLGLGVVVERPVTYVHAACVRAGEGGREGEELLLVIVHGVYEVYMWVYIYIQAFMIVYQRHIPHYTQAAAFLYLRMKLRAT